MRTMFATLSLPSSACIAFGYVLSLLLFECSAQIKAALEELQKENRVMVKDDMVYAVS